MGIEIHDLSPEVNRLQMIKITDIYGKVLVVKGWA